MGSECWKESKTLEDSFGKYSNLSKRKSGIRFENQSANTNFPMVQADSGIRMNWNKSTALPEVATIKKENKKKEAISQSNSF